MATMKIPTKEQMAEMLEGVNVAEVAKAAGISEKTIYRLRWKQTRPSLETLESLMPVLTGIKRKASAKVAA